MSKGDEYDLDAFVDDKPFVITDDVQVVFTPGHTLDNVSVVVKSHDQGTVVIAGDVFEKDEDLKDDSILKEAVSESPEKQIENRKKSWTWRILLYPDMGPMFENPARSKT